VSHTLILPILLPFAAGIGLLFMEASSVLIRRLSLAATIVLIPLAALLLMLCVIRLNQCRLGDFPKMMIPRGVRVVSDGRHTRESGYPVLQRVTGFPHTRV
jgi:hypothetical protein